MTSYKEISKELLIEKIEELDILVGALRQEKNDTELLKFPWVGNLGHWHWNVKANSVICNDAKILALNYSKEEIPKEIGFEFFTSKLHPEDYENVMENMREHLIGNIAVHEVEYRIQTKEGGWKWYYDRGKIVKRDDKNKPLLLSGIVFDITEKKEMELLIKRQNEKLEELVRFDYLTKALNRRGLVKELKSQVSISKQNKEKLSIIMMDIDKFKVVNDTKGHLVGDKVLIQVSETIKKNMLGTDFVGRYGGEEFLIILPKTSREEAYIVGERIRKSIKDEEFANGTRITISGGVKEYEGESIDAFIDEADKYLYHAKENGRNKIVYEI